MKKYFCNSPISFRLLFVLLLLSCFGGITKEVGAVTTKTTVTTVKVKAKEPIVQKPLKPIADLNLTRIFYYRPSIKAFTSLALHPGSLDVLAPQTYGVNADGELSGSIDPQVMAVTLKNQIKVMPLVVNSGFSQSAIHTILDNPAVQDKIIAALIAEGKKNGYWGWQFDFEQMTSDYRDRYSAFIARAYPQFKQNNLILSVAVISKISDNPADYPKDLWNRVIGVYDYAALASSSDFISLMSYDQPQSAGPVAGLSWVEQVVTYSLRFIPAKKLSLGIPFYYWKWDDVTGKLVGIGGYQGIRPILDDGLYLRHGWSEPFATSWVEYIKEGKKYTTWYEDGQSFVEKLKLAQRYGLVGFSAWVLGLEDPAIHRALKR